MVQKQKTVEITVGDDGVKFDYNGFAGEACFDFGNRLEKLMAEDGVRVDAGGSVRRKQPEVNVANKTKTNVRG